MSVSNQLTRRNALKTIAGAGLATSLVSATPDYPTVDIPKLARGDQILEYLTVPEDWNQHRKTVQRVYERFGKNYANKDGVFSMGIGKSEKLHGGVPGHQINVRIDPDRFQGHIPNQYDGVPVNITEKPDVHGPGSDNNYDNCHNTEGDLDIEGGDEVGCDRTNSWVPHVVL